jgi:hypothetical protein
MGDVNTEGKEVSPSQGEAAVLADKAAESLSPLEYERWLSLVGKASMEIIQHIKEGRIKRQEGPL